MPGEFDKERFKDARIANSAEDLDADWNYLRAHLDHPTHLRVTRLGSGLATWLLRRLHPTAEPQPPLSMIARLPLGPRQALALVEAEGVRLLVGTSADGPLSFLPLPRGPGSAAPYSVPLSGQASAQSASQLSPPLQLSPDGSFVRAPDDPASLRRINASSRGGFSPPSKGRGSRPANRAGLLGRVSW